MTVEGIDYSEGHPGGAAIAAAGKRFVIRYVPYGGYAKGLTAPELADLRANGLAVGLVFESDDHRALGGIVVPVIDDAYAVSLGISRPRVTPSYAGAADAWWSNRQAASLGFPAAQPIYFGVDFDANVGQRSFDLYPDDRPALADYFRGAAGSIGLARVGVYASYWVVEWAFANGLVSWGWQTYAWSGGRVSTRAHLYQYRNGQYLNGQKVDLDRAQATNYGQWAPPLPDSSTGGDVDPAKEIPVGSVAVLAGATAYYDLASTQVAIQSTEAFASVGAYSTDTRSDGKVMVRLRWNIGGGGQPDNWQSVWVGKDKTAPVADPTPWNDADQLAAEQKGYDLAANGAKITFPPRP